MSKKIIAEGYIQSVRGELTLVGVLNRYFYENENGEEISRHWLAESTRRQYINDIERRLVPNCYNSIPLAEYTQEDVIRIMKTIQKRYEFDEKEMAHYRLLFWRIYVSGLTNHLFEDKLHWVELEIVGRKQKNTDAKRRLAAQKRSLTIREEIRLLTFFSALKPDTAPGEAYALLMMYIIPLRNQEACGLDFGDYRLYTSQQVSSIYVYKSTGANTNMTKAGGKTGNMFRILPVLPFAARLISERKEYIEKAMAEKCHTLSANSYIDMLPIACRGLSFKQRCKTGDISNYARELFQKLGIGQAALDEATYELYTKSGIEEESPTAYLLRKNALNHLWDLCFERQELEYCMGHFISDDEWERNSFINEEVYLSLNKKLQRHPAEYIAGGRSPDAPAGILTEPDFYGSIKNICLPVCEEERVYTAEFFANEVNEEFEITFSENTDCMLQQGFYYGNRMQHEYIDIADYVIKEYVQEYEKMREEIK